MLLVSARRTPLTSDESRCQVVFRAAAPVEDLFFPDAETSQGDTDQILAEGLTEALVAPARPNISVYNYTPTPAEAPQPKSKIGPFSALSVLGEDERFSFVSSLPNSLTFETRSIAVD